MWRAIIAIGLVIGATVVVTPQPVFACSCEMMNANAFLRRADAAFVGTLISREDESSGDEVTWTFQVEQAVKGEIGEKVDVQSAVYSAACGLAVSVGQRVGIFLTEINGLWHSSSCSQVDPETLLAATQELPAPNGSGPVALLLGNRGENPRIIALDREGRVLAYGAGDGEVRSISVCPGSERSVELVAYSGEESRHISVRDLRSLQQANEYALPDASLNVMTVYCRDQAGSYIVIHEVSYPDDKMTSQVHQIQNGELTTLYSAEMGLEGGHQAAFDFDDGVAYLSVGERGNDIVRVELNTGEGLPLAFIPAIEGELEYIISLSLSPDGKRLAAVGYQPGPTAHFRTFVFDLSTDPVEVQALALGSDMYFSSAFWLSDETFIVTADDETSVGSPVFNTDLEQVGSIPGWLSRNPVLVNDTLYGLGWYGTLQVARLPEEPATTLHTFDNPNIYVMAGVPDEIEIEPVVSQAPDATATVAPARTIRPATPTVETGTSMVGDVLFGDSDADSESSTAPDNRGWWLILGLLVVTVAGGGWGVYWLRGN